MPGHQRAAKIINIGLSSWSQCPYSLDLAALLVCRLLTAALSSLINELFFFPWLVRLLSMCSAFLSRCSQRNDSNQWYITASHSFYSCLCWFFPYCPARLKTYQTLRLSLPMQSRSIEPCSPSENSAFLTRRRRFHKICSCKRFSGFSCVQTA